MAKEFKGVIPPVITSFGKDGKFDENAQREVISFLTPKVNGFYPVGTYGSGPLMSVEERKRVAEVVIDEVGGRVPVIVHVGSPSTSQTVELAKAAEAAGADAVGAIPPYYYKYSDQDLLEHFRALIKSVRIPVFAYNNPGLSGNPLKPELITTLAAEGLAGLKDSSFDLVTFYKYLDAVEDPQFMHIIGTEAIAAPAIQSGAKGTVSGLANVWPELMGELWESLQKDHARETAVIQKKVNQARNVMKYGSTLVVCYEVLRLRGINAGIPRLPYLPLDGETAKRVKLGFEKLGLLN